MLKPIVISACLAVLMGGTAFAQDEQSCMDQLAKTEALVDERVQAKALAEGEVEDVNMLLDEADQACTEGRYKKATKTLANVKKIVTPPAE